ncbi:unnamed protein product [Musa textilis]
MIGVKHFRHILGLMTSCILMVYSLLKVTDVKQNTVLLEMDRILRPNGYVIICESNYFVDSIAAIVKGMRWGCQKHDTENNVEKKLLICQKKLWHSKRSQQ